MALNPRKRNPALMESFVEKHPEAMKLLKRLRGSGLTMI